MAASLSYSADGNFCWLLILAQTTILKVFGEKIGLYFINEGGNAPQH